MLEGKIQNVAHSQMQMQQQFEKLEQGLKVVEDMINLNNKLNEMLDGRMKNHHMELEKLDSRVYHIDKKYEEEVVKIKERLEASRHRIESNYGEFTRQSDKTHE